MPAAPTLPHRPVQTARPSAAVVALPTWAELEAYVQERVAAVNVWNADATRLERTPLTKAGQPCGVLFRAFGPKRLTAHAIWSAPEQRLLFYDSAGRRAEEVRLCEAPLMSSCSFPNS